MTNLHDLQARRAAHFKQRTSDGTRTYQRYYKDAERSAGAARRANDHAAAALGYAK
jgi:hypothetical protein